MRILFVCTGNICRSPCAKVIMEHICKDDSLFEIDSCATTSYHVGEQADSRMRALVKKHGLDLDEHRVKAFDLSFFEKFDLLVCMDESHYYTLAMKASKKQMEQIVYLRQYDTNPDSLNVGDPYYDNSFEQVYEIIERCCYNLYAVLKKEQEE
ncbi:MAG: low molecular weight protein-tyrosine-phosphatase [Candidatus Woesearchaeota archaeon]